MLRPSGGTSSVPFVDAVLLRIPGLLRLRFLGSQFWMLGMGLALCMNGLAST
jgi:hypothetical protein